MKKLLKAQKIGTFDPTKVDMWNPPQSYYPASDRQNAPARQLSAEEIAKQKAAAVEALRLKKLYEQQELARRKQAIAASDKALMDEASLENLAIATNSLGERVRFFPDDPNSFIDNYVNPLPDLANTAGGLFQVPYNLQQGDYKQAGINIAVPAITAALARVGAKGAGQFINNLVNPFAGMGIKRFPHITNSRLGTKQLSSSGNIPKSATELSNTGFKQDPYYHYGRFLDKKEEIGKAIRTDEGRKRIQGYIDRNPHLQNKTVDDIISDFEKTKFETKRPIYNSETGEWYTDDTGNLSFFDVDPDNAYNWYRDGYENPSYISMGQNYTPYDAMHILEHEFGHLFQRGSEVIGVDDVLGSIALKTNENLYKKTFKDYFNQYNPFVQKVDDVGYSVTGNVYGTAVNNQNRLNNLKHQKDYWLSGAGRGQEKAAFAAEVRENLLQRGILKNRYDEITPKMLEDHFKLYHNTKGNKYNLRLYDIMTDDKNNFNFLSQALNRMPAALPYVGAGFIGYKGLQGTGALQEQKNGGMIKRKDGSYSRKGLWDNIRDNAGSGKKPTAEMLKQERKIRNEKKEMGGSLPTYDTGKQVLAKAKELSKTEKFKSRNYAGKNCSVATGECFTEAGVKIPARTAPFKIAGTEYKAGMPLPIIPSTREFEQYAEPLGFKKVEGEYKEGDRIHVVDDKNNPYHSMIYAGKNKKGEDQYYSDSGEGTDFKLIKWPGANIRGYRYVGDEDSNNVISNEKSPSGTPVSNQPPQLRNPSITPQVTNAPVIPGVTGPPIIPGDNSLLSFVSGQSQQYTKANKKGSKNFFIGDNIFIDRNPDGSLDTSYTQSINDPKGMMSFFSDKNRSEIMNVNPDGTTSFRVPTDAERQARILAIKNTTSYPKVKEMGGFFPTSTTGVPYQDKEYMYQGGGEKEEDKDSWLENLVEILDPTGLTSYDDVYRAYKNSGLSPELFIETIGALPLIGKVGKLAQTGSKLAIKLLTDPNLLAATSKRGMPLASFAAFPLGAAAGLPYFGRVSDATQAALGAKDNSGYTTNSGVPMYGGRNIFPSTKGKGYEQFANDKQFGKYQTGGETDYNIDRANELGYKRDETGHLPSVDSTNGMWLKSKKHPTAFLEYLQSLLNPKLQNQQVVVNPEGYFGNEQLQYVPKKQGGGSNPPIKVRNPNDHRLQAYQDSSDVYNLSTKVVGNSRNLPEVSQSEYNEIVNKDKNLDVYDIDTVQYNIDKTKGEVKDFKSYVYKRKRDDYEHPIFKKNNQTELNKYTDDYEKHSIKNQDGTVLIPSIVYEGKPDWTAGYTKHYPNGTSRFYILKEEHRQKNYNNSKTGKRPPEKEFELASIYNPKIKPIDTKFYGKKNPTQGGDITLSSTGFYSEGDKPSYKETDKFKNYYYEYDYRDIYKKPEQLFIYDPNAKIEVPDKIPYRTITQIPYNRPEQEFVPLDIPQQEFKRNPPQKFYYGKDKKQEKRRLAGKPYTALNSSGAEIYIASGDTRLNSDPENTIGYNKGRAYVEGDRMEEFEPTRDTQNNPISKEQMGGNIYDKETDNLLAQIASMIADGEDPDMVAGSLVDNGYSEEVVDSLVEEAIDRLSELGDYEEEDINQLEDIKVLREGGIPDRYKNQGFTKVGAKRKSNRPGKKWMVLAKKGNKYKIVHGGYKGMKDYTQHGSEERRERFWDRMGGKNSAKAKDPFSPLYWHKRFGTWQDGGKTPIEHPEGQRKFPGKTTRIPSNRITMEGINYPVLAIGDNGKANLMLPGEEYLYIGVNYVDEVPFSK